MRLVSAEEVYQICQGSKLRKALAEAHHGPKPLTAHSMIEHGEGDESQTYLNISAWLPGTGFACKSITVLPGNPARQPGLQAIQALVNLFDGKTGSPRAVIDGTSLTYVKTAADSALGAELLARPDAQVLTLVGTGGLAVPVIRAHLEARPSIERVQVWGRRPEAAHAVAEAISAEFADAQAIEDLEGAVRNADIVSCVTASREPLVKGAWLKPGAHLDLIGGFTPEMRECDDDAVRLARLFVDSPWSAVESCGDICDPLSRGVIARSDIEADLFDLCSGAFQLDRADGDVTLFKNGGGAHLDLFTALFIAETMESAS